MSFETEIQLLAVVVAAACALPGVFLVLRRMALMSDAISHSILLGIVLGFFVVEDIKRGELITANNVRSVRPGQGLPPKELRRVLGSRARHDLTRGEPLGWSDFDPC